MRVRNATRWSKTSKINRYLLAILIFASVFSVRLLLDPLFGQYMPYQLFLYAGCVTAFFWGGGAGAIIVIFGTVAGSFFFVEPYLQFTTPTVKDLVLLSNYLASCFLAIVAIEYLQCARHKNELLLRVADSRYKTLLHRDNRRMVLEQQAQKMTKI
jgi:K+-sensing histidine kinase KdpD